MKKITFIFLTSLILSSCNDGDKKASLIIKSFQYDVNNYNQIRRMTKDTVVINYIDKIKLDYTKEVYEIKGIINYQESYLNKFDTTKYLLNNIIDSLK